MVPIDAVVPTLDEAGCIAALVERLLRGGDAPADRVQRVIVVDGGSRDATRELAHATGAEVLLAARGRGAQLAAGARHATAELLLFLHADSCPAPGALACARRALQDARFGAAAFRQRIDADGIFFRALEACADRRVERGRGLGDSGLVVRRALYESVGGFREIPLFEDLDLARRLRARTRMLLVRDGVLEISARRWRREGALRATLRNRILRGAFALGVEPARLARFYPPHAQPS